ncbi:MAG: hypothetical protein ACFFD1_13040 [Candidatus Thorarchaeota archaeon]
MFNKIKEIINPEKILHRNYSSYVTKHTSSQERLLSMKRLDQLSIELLLIQSLMNFDVFNFSVPEYADNLMFYIGELFNQSILCN